MAPIRPSHTLQPFQPPQPTQTPRTLQPSRPTQPPQQKDDQEMTTPKSVSSNSSSDALPLQSLSQLAGDASTEYQYLRFEWAESDAKWEYIARYSPLRTGFWLASAPQRNYSRFAFYAELFIVTNKNNTVFSEYRSSELPKFRVFAGTIQVIIADQNHLVLTFCELIPRQQLFSVILARQSNALSMDVSSYLNLKFLCYAKFP